MTIFASTEPKNDDLSPWLSIGLVEFRTTTEWGTCTYSPRPEYNRPRSHKANPILLFERESDINIENVRETLAWIDDPNTDAQITKWVGPYTAEHSDHAHKVLSRWLVVFGS